MKDVLFYNFMIDSNIAVRNPLARIKSLKGTKDDKIRTLCTEEVQAPLAKTKNIYPDFYPLLFTAIFTGMRQGELLTLTWDSINWITKKITIDKNFTNGHVGTPKTNKIRYIDMSNELAKVLKQWKLDNLEHKHFYYKLFNLLIDSTGFLLSFTSVVICYLESIGSPLSRFKALLHNKYSRLVFS